MTLLLLFNNTTPATPGTGTGGYVATLRELTPIPRYDGTAWTTLQIEEAPIQTGAWTLLGSLDLVADVDPSQPEPRQLTITGANYAAGWYRLTFLDVAGKQQPLAPIFNGASVTPTLTQVADLIRTYVRDTSGELPNFTADSRPTAQQVENYISHGLRRVRSKLGPIYLASGDYTELADDATHAVALYAAAMAVLARTPQSQTGTGASHFEHLKGLFDEAMVDLDKAAAEIGAGEQIGAIDDRPTAHGVFPAPVVAWDREQY